MSDALLLRSLVRAASSRRSHPHANALALCTGGSVGLCRAHSTRQTGGFANLGDALSAVIVSALSGRAVHDVPFAWPVTKLVAVGSIGHAIKYGTAVVWGAGVSTERGLLQRNARFTRYDVRAIRGPISAEHYKRVGISVPDVYGDPVWLLPSILSEPVEKRFELGVIPHIQDVDGTQPHSPPRQESLRWIVDEADAEEIAVINTWHESTWEGLLAKVGLIRSCKRVVSQSFHGVVIAEAYGIPVLHFSSAHGMRNGPRRIDLDQPCDTDPRVWEFYAGGRRSEYYMYVQRRKERTDWEKVIRAIDRYWQPFEFDAAPLVDAFPLPLAFDPLTERARSFAVLERLRF